MQTFAILLLTLCSTVKPPTEVLVQRSQMIVEATVIRVESLDPDTDYVTIKPTRYFSGVFAHQTTPLRFTYRKLEDPSVGNYGIDFAKLRESSKPYIFYMCFDSDDEGNKAQPRDSFHLRLVSAWFGVEKSDSGLIQIIEALLAAEKQMYNDALHERVKKLRAKKGLRD